MTPEFDVVVVGGGPAGATCARSLALAGRAVCVIDKEAPPRYKTCGGALVGRAVRMLDLNLRPAVEAEPSILELNLLDSGVSLRVERPEAPVLMTMRADLDDFLLRGAREDGATLRAPCALRALEQHEEGVSVLTDRGEISAHFVVAADGASSRTARLAGWPENRRCIPALESELFVDSAELERFAGRVRFDFDSIPNGYTWLFPKRRHLSVGCLSTKRGTRDLRSSLDRWLERIGLDPDTPRQDHGFVIPVAPRARSLASGRILLVGDAAGLADPVTCEGISHAILSGRLAAEAIVAGSDSPDEVRQSYGRSLSRDILPELRAARLLARLLYDFPRVRAAVFRRVGPRMCEAMSDIFSGERTFRGLVAHPGTYLRVLGGLLRPWRS